MTFNQREFVEHARQFVGVLYKKEGITPAGLDCYGLIVLALKKFNIKTEMPNFVIYPLKIEEIKHTMREYADPIAFNQLQPGDIVWLNVAGHTQHAAIISDKGIIHAYDVVKQVVEHSFSKKWVRRYRLGYRVRWQ